MRYGFKDVVIDSRTGLNPRKNFALGNGENNYITIKDIFNGQINITDKTDKVDDEAIQIIKKRSRIKVGDILFVSIGRIGETAIVENKDDTWDVNESVFVFTINREIITPEYFCTLFQSDAVQKYLAGNSSGSTFKSIKMNQLEKMVFDLPPLEIQDNITARLSKIKAICAQRSSELTCLDKLIKARFVETFGDPKLNPHCYPVQQLSKHIQFLTSGSRGWSEYCVDSGREWFITIKNVKDCHISIDNMQPINVPCNAEAKRTRVQEGDLLISITADLGRTGVVSKEIADHGAYINQHLTCIRLNRDVLEPLYVAYYMESPAGKEQIISKNQSAVKAGLNFNSINSLQVFVPPLSIQKEFVGFVLKIERIKNSIESSIIKMKMLYDSLMQGYFR